jgi:hypothetical protein
MIIRLLIIYIFLAEYRNIYIYIYMDLQNPEHDFLLKEIYMRTVLYTLLEEYIDDEYGSSHENILISLRKIGININEDIFVFARYSNVYVADHSINRLIYNGQNNIVEKSCFLLTHIERHAIAFYINIENEKIVIINSGLGVDLHGTKDIVSDTRDQYNTFQTYRCNKKIINKFLKLFIELKLHSVIDMHKLLYLLINIRNEDLIKPPNSPNGYEYSENDIIKYNISSPNGRYMYIL